MSKRKNRFYTRRFLNRRGYHAGAYIIAAVEDTSAKSDDYGWTDVCFTIADCGRQIDLSFDVDEDSLANSLYKVDVIIETLANFRMAMEEEGAVQAARTKRVKAKKKSPKGA